MIMVVVLKRASVSCYFMRSVSHVRAVEGSQRSAIVDNGFSAARDGWRFGIPSTKRSRSIHRTSVHRGAIDSLHMHINTLGIGFDRCDSPSKRPPRSPNARCGLAFIKRNRSPFVNKFLERHPLSSTCVGLASQLFGLGLPIRR